MKLGLIQEHGLTTPFELVGITSLNRPSTRPFSATIGLSNSTKLARLNTKTIV